MNIQLPRRFFYSSGWRSRAYVQGRVLYLEGDVNYEDLMYSLAYSISGYEKCVYCGEKLKKETRTLDHKYPRCWGGISIPDNLVPSCKKCNSDKGNMTEEQYKIWREADIGERSMIFSHFTKQNEEEMKNGFLLPNGWVTPFDVAQVIDRLEFEKIGELGNEKVDLYYELHGHYPRPIVVSRNNWVFKGIHILYHAKKNGIKVVSCIRLDNVIRITD